MKYRIILRGFLGTLGIKFKKHGTSGTNSARYCYSVYLRHLVCLYNNGYVNLPSSVAEIGPGDSLGIGLTAMLCGANEYYGFDIIDHASYSENLKIFEELLLLFQSRENIPSNNEFSRLKPEIENYDFPFHILCEEHLNKTLDVIRISKIREALVTGESSEIVIKYIVPWNELKVKLNTLDLILSQAVMEHVLDVEAAYGIMQKWLRTGGIISHEIDYSAHETHEKWNGHWYFSDMLWFIIMKGRKYAINRLPHSVHINIISRSFKIITEVKDLDPAGIKSRIESDWEFKDDDFSIRSALIQAVK